MSRVDELQKKYPSLPREIIVRCDVGVHGVRDTKKLDHVGQWVNVIGIGTYANYDFDETLQDWVAANPGRLKPGAILRPGRFVHPESGRVVGDRINTKSDLEVREEDPGKFAIYEEEERVDAVLYQPPKVKNEYTTSKGTPESHLLRWMTKACFMLAAVRHCEYFPLGLACKFCNYNPTQDQARALGLERPVSINLEETLEAYKAYAAESYVVDGRFEMGGFTKSENETRIYANFVEKMASATSYKPNFTLNTQPMQRKEMQRLKDAGLDSPTFQMEIWDPDLFAEVVPGKAKYTGRDRYLEAFQEAVDVFGWGSVGVAFVGGVSMIPENGHKTWQEARDSLVEGNTWMIQHGVMPLFLPLRLSPGAEYASDENRRKLPPTEYYLDAAIAHNEACKEYGLYDKYNRFVWCPLDCMSPYSGELGAIELAGSAANWAAAVMPRESNWHCDWEEQRKSVSTT